MPFVAVSPDFGYLTFVAGLVHSILHAARYIYANTADIMYKTDACRSGLIACFLLLPIVLPMKFELLRTNVRNAAQCGPFLIHYSSTREVVRVSRKSLF